MTSPHPKLPVVRSFIIALCVLGLTLTYVHQAAATIPAEAPTAEMQPLQQETNPDTAPITPQTVPNLSGFALVGVGGLMTVVFGLGMLVMTQDEL